MKGVINDGAASLWRLYQNNFRDGFRQTVVDLTLGLIPLDSVLRDVMPEQAAEPEDGDEEVLKEEQDASTYSIQGVRSRFISFLLVRFFFFVPSCAILFHCTSFCPCSCYHQSRQRSSVLSLPRKLHSLPDGSVCIWSPLV